MKKLMIVLMGLWMLTGCGDNQKTSSENQAPAPVAAAVAAAPASMRESSQITSAKLLIAGRQDLIKGNIPAAIKSFDTAIKQNPRDPGAYLVLGETYLHVRNYDKAIDTLTAALIVDPKSGSANYLLALAYNFKGDKESAIQHAQKSTQIFQDTKDADNFKKSLLLLQGLTQVNGSPNSKI